MPMSNDTLRAFASSAERGDFRAIAAMLREFMAGLFNGLTVAGNVGVTGTASVGGLVLTPAAVTATSDGLTTGLVPAAAAFVTVTSANANNIVTLPEPVVGKVIVLRNGATGYELRSSAPTTIAINGGTGANAESAIAASTMVIAVCTTATTWQAFGLAGTTFAAVEAAA